ncbi:MAG TPA: dihydrolipoyl dehydrogenase [Ktedonobacterales bacterium]|nr:dihydrolipoyl dehydrogenase [Ktedonobacterales bacterium]
MATDQNQFDVFVIGSGIGGYVAAIRAAQLGGRIGIVEKQYIGGTCLNVGCIPSKALLHIAQTYAQFAELGKLGIKVETPPKFDMSVAVAFKDKVVKQLTGGVAQLLKANGVTLFEGTATAKSPTQVAIALKDGTTREITTRKLILANGSVVIRPPFPGLDGRNVIFSDDAMNMPKVPDSLVCIGGGVIAVELACMFHALGTKVTIVEMLPSIIANEDEEVRKALTRSLTKRGIQINTGATVQSIEDAGNLKRVTASTASGPQTFDGEYVLVAVGRKANPTGLDGLVSAGLAMDRGRVVANERMETNLPGVYAIGDLVGKTWLAHVAETEGEVAAENALGHDAKMDYTVVPRPIFTFPEIASVGLTEAQARERSQNVRAEKFPWVANGKALASDETEGFTKVILGEYGELLGAAIFGPDATNLITEFSLAMRAELTADEVIATIHPHPTYSEALREATLAAEHRPIHIFMRTAAAANR